MVSPAVSAMSRQQLLGGILQSDVHVNGVPAPKLVDRALVEQLSRIRTSNSHVVAVAGLQGFELLRAVVSIWTLDAVPMIVPAVGGVDLAGFCTLRGGGASFDVVPGVRQIPDTDRVAIIHASSGSTGPPKLVKRSIESLVDEAEGYRSGLGLDAGLVVDVWAPIEHSFGWGCAFASLRAGCHLRIGDFVRPNAVAAELLPSAHRTAVSVLTVPMVRLLLGARPTPLDETRPRREHRTLVGAGTLSDELEMAFERKFDTAVLRGYGSTETGGVFIGKVGIGCPIPSVSVLSPEPGSQGELVLQLASGVSGAVGHTGAMSRVWRSGDLVRRHDEGTFEFVRRLDTAVRLNGRFLHTDDLRLSILSVDGVEDVHFRVTPRPTLEGMDDLHVLVVSSTASQQTVERAIAHLGMSDWVQITIVEAIPETILGKLDIGELEQLEQGGTR